MDLEKLDLEKLEKLNYGFREVDLAKVDLVAKSGFRQSGFSLKKKAVMDLASSGFSEVDLAQRGSKLVRL